MPRRTHTPPRQPIHPDMPEPTLTQYGVEGHKPKCRVVSRARAGLTTGASFCDCGARRPNQLPESVPVTSQRVWESL